jgi:hypothetical protein
VRGKERGQGGWSPVATRQEGEAVPGRGGADMGSVRRPAVDGARQAVAQMVPCTRDSWLAQLGWRGANWLPLGRANWATCAGNGNGPHEGEKKIKEGRQRKEKWAGWILAQEGFEAPKNGFLFEL